MRILGIETSCDETGIAIYDAKVGLLAHALYSQIAIHAEYGGVVPELASRDDLEYDGTSFPHRGSPTQPSEGSSSRCANDGRCG